MSLQLINGAEFLHIPKTGGAWVEKMLRSQNLVEDSVGHKHADYDRNLFRSTMNSRHHFKRAISLTWNKVSQTLERVLERVSSPIEEPVFRFCFVRHPLTWYESYWRYMQGRGWNDWGRENSRRDWHPNAMLNGLGTDDFNQFVRNVIQKRPGYVSELMFSYTKPGISYIGKTEHLREDLHDILTALNLPFEPSVLASAPKCNESIVEASRVQWDSELRELVVRLELPALLHFDYLSETEQQELGIDLEVSPHPSLSSEIRKHSYSIMQGELCHHEL